MKRFQTLFLFLAGVLLIPRSINSAGSLTPTPGMWSQLGHDTSRNYVSVEPIAPPLGIRWRAESDLLHSPAAPIVSQSAMGDIAIWAATDGGLRAIRISDGKILWSIHAPAGFSASPAAVLWAGQAYVISVDNNGRLDTRFPDSGALVWRYELGVAGSRTPLVMGDPAAPGQAPRVLVIDGTGKITAFALQTGQKLWNSNSGLGEAPSCDLAGDVISGSVIACGRKGMLKAFSISNGSLTGQYRETAQAAGILISGDRAYATFANGKVEALNPATLAVYASGQVSSSVLAPPSLASSSPASLLVHHANGNRSLVQDNGSTFTVTPLNAASSALIVPSTVFPTVWAWASRNGSLGLSKASTGDSAKIFENFTNGPGYSAPLVPASQEFLALNDNGRLTAFSSVIYSLDKSASSSTVAFGDTVTYTLVAHNLSDSQSLAGVKICDKIPLGMSLISSNPTGIFQNGILTWDVGSLNASASSTLSVVLRADAFGVFDCRSSATLGDFSPFG